MEPPTHCERTGAPLYAHVEHRSYPEWLGDDGATIAQWRGEEWDALSERPAQARAVYLRDTPFEDHLCYAERRPTRRPIEGWEHPFGWVRPPIDDRSLRRAVGRAIGAMRLWTPLPTIDDDELVAAVAEAIPEALLARLPDGFERETATLVRAALRPARQEARWEHGEAQDNLFGQVTAEGERRVMSWLVGAGARRERHWADSGTVASVGERRRLSLGDVQVHYVPHSWIDEEWRTEFHHEVRLPGVCEVVRRRLLEAVTSRYEQYADPLEELLEVDDGERRWIETRRRTGEDEWRRATEAAESGGEVRRRGSRCVVRFVTDERLESHPGRRVESGWLSEAMSARLAEYEEAIDELMGSAWRWRWTDGSDEHPSDGRSRAGFRSAVAAGVGEGFGRPTRVVRLLERYVPWELLVWERRESRRLVSVVHDATRSERGLLRIEGASAEAAAELLREAGLCGEWLERVPASLARFGRVLPHHPVYRRTRPALPSGRLLVHGLTGAHDAASAIERMRSLVAAGGIKSIYERRRMAIDGGPTLSPTGDVHSGLDEGVPTILGDPVFGRWVFFVLRPGSLARRDLWFAPGDYGGSSSRYDLYNDYAERIGQGKLHWPAGDAARSEHYRTGLGHSNETYLRYEVAWEEIAAVIVDEQIAIPVTEMLMGAGDRRVLPEGIEIVVGGRRDVPSVVERARRRYADEYDRLVPGDGEDPVSGPSALAGAALVV